jgi:hypothetical protein
VQTTAVTTGVKEVGTFTVRGTVRKQNEDRFFTQARAADQAHPDANDAQPRTL